MAETHPFRLSQDEIVRQAKKFFGNTSEWELVRDEPRCLRFNGAHGFVQLDIHPDTNNQSRVVIEHEGYNDQIHALRRQLSKQSAAETSLG